MPQNAPRVLLAEDEALVAMETEYMLEQCGCRVLGPAGTVGGALALLHGERPDGAVLDIHLRDAPIWPVLRLLYERDVPFILVTGYDVPALPGVARGSTVLAKPTTLSALADALGRLGVIEEGQAPPAG